jgi:hypothetical protein
VIWYGPRIICPWAVFNIEVFNICQMPFWPSKKFFLWGVLHKNVLCTISTLHKASQEIAYQKIQCLHFANKNIVGLQSRYSSILSFQISISFVILIMQLQLNTNCNFGSASTSICEHGFSKHNWVKSDRIRQMKLATLDALVRVSLCNLPMENMNWARVFDT